MRVDGGPPLVPQPHGEGESLLQHMREGLRAETQKEGNNEIWIDVYPLTRFLAKHTQAAVKVEGTKEWVRTADIVDPAVEEYEAQQ